jgi:hypothetical protein
MGNYYVAYMLRLWMTEEAGKMNWRASLECPRTGDMLYFASLTRLFQFLESGEKIPERGEEGDTSRDPPSSEERDLKTE